MHHQGTKNIETERLVLRPFILEDAPFAYANWESDPRVTEFLRWPTYHSPEDAEAMMAQWVAQYPDKSFYHWAIELKDIRQPIGCIGVVDMDERTDKVHIGYCIGSRWWNRGCTSEAFAAIIPFLFREVRVGRIESQHDPDNLGSGRVMQKCGLQYEGTLRKADWSNRGIVDACMYSLLASDFFQRQT